VERRADHRLVLAQHVRLRHGELFFRKSLYYPVLAVDSMRRRQQLARRFAAQNIFLPIRGGKAVRRVRLPTLELLDLRDAKAEEFLERGLIDAVALLDRLRADELLEHGRSLLYTEPEGHRPF